MENEAKASITDYARIAANTQGDPKAFQQHLETLTIEELLALKHPDLSPEDIERFAQMATNAHAAAGLDIAPIDDKRARKFIQDAAYLAGIEKQSRKYRKK